MSAEVQSSSEISVQWSGLNNCRLVNGIITKYRVLYTAANSGDQEQSEDYTLRDDQNWMSGGEITLTGLSSSTYYSISVAAVNENGDVGQSSTSVRTRTDQCNRFIPIINMLWLMFVLCCSLWFRVDIQCNWYSCWSCGRPTNILLFLCDATVCGCESDSLQSSSSTGIVVGVVVGLLGVAVGISGLIGGAFIAKRHR